MREPDARKVCDHLCAWYCTYGAPEEQASDGGPPFQGMEYTQFLQNWGIRQHLSSAHYAQSNVVLSPQSRQQNKSSLTTLMPVGIWIVTVQLEPS